MTSHVFIDGRPAGWVDAGELTVEDGDGQELVVRSPGYTTGPALNLTWQGTTAALHTFLGLDLTDAPAPRYTLITSSSRPARLLTGRRGNRRRVDHARELRMATWKRRRQRRHGIPAATVLTRLHFPHLRMELT